MGYRFLREREATAFKSPTAPAQMPAWPKFDLTAPSEQKARFSVN